MLPEVTAALSSVVSPAPSCITRVRPINGTSDVAVLSLGRRRERPFAVVKLPVTEAAREELAKQQKVLELLRADSRLGEWRNLLPRSRLCDTGPDTFAVEGSIPGVTAAHLLARRPSLRPWVAWSGLAAIRDLHQRTTRLSHIEAQAIDRWLAEPITLLRTIHPSGHVAPAQVAAAAMIECRIRESIVGRPLAQSWVHGDFTPGNVMVTEDAVRVTGVIDWGQASPCGVPSLDALLWILTIYADDRSMPLGRLTRSALTWSVWPKDDPVLRLACDPIADSGVDHGTLVLLCWLNHVADNLRNTQRYSKYPWWWAANVEPVLEAVGQ